MIGNQGEKQNAANSVASRTFSDPQFLVKSESALATQWLLWEVVMQVLYTWGALFGALLLTAQVHAQSETNNQEAVFQQGSELYQQHCADGDSAGCVNLAILFEKGFGVTKDKPRALQLYRRALTLSPNPESAKMIQARINDLSAVPARRRAKRKH